MGVGVAQLYRVTCANNSTLTHGTVRHYQVRKPAQACKLYLVFSNVLGWLKQYVHIITILPWNNGMAVKVGSEQQSTQPNFSSLTCHLQFINTAWLQKTAAICRKQGSTVWSQADLVQKAQLDISARLRNTEPPPKPSTVFTYSSIFFFFFLKNFMQMTERDVSRPVVHRSLPKHLKKKLIQTLSVAHNKADKHAGKGVWLWGRLIAPDWAGPH